MGDSGVITRSKRNSPVDVTQRPVSVVVTQRPVSPLVRKGDAGSAAARPSSNIFGVFADDGKESEKGDGAEDSGASFPAHSPFFSSWFSKNLADGKFPYMSANEGSLPREALGFQCFVDSVRPVTDTAFTAQTETVLSQLRQLQDFDVHAFQAIPVLKKA